MKKPHLLAIAGMITTLLLGACASTTPLDGAYASGSVFATAPYTRTIFSSSNF